MSKGCTRLFFTIVIIVLVIGYGIFFLQWIFKIGYAQFAQISEIYICKVIEQTPEFSFEKVNPTITDKVVGELFVCGFLETDGRPAKLSTTVRNSQGELVYYENNVYRPGRIHIPFTMPVGSEGNFDIQIYKGRTILGKVTVTLENP